MLPITQSKKQPAIWFGEEIGDIFRRNLEEAYILYPEYWGVSFQIHSVNTTKNIDHLHVLWTDINLLTYYPVSNTMLAAMVVYQLPLLRNKFTDKQFWQYDNLYTTSLIFALARLPPDKLTTFADVPFISVIGDFVPTTRQQEFIHNMAVDFVTKLESFGSCNEYSIPKMLGEFDTMISDGFPAEFGDVFVYKFSPHYNVEFSDQKMLMRARKLTIKMFSTVYFADMKNNVSTTTKIFQIACYGKSYAVCAKIDGMVVYFSIAGQDE